MPSAAPTSYHLRAIGLSLERFAKQQRWLWRYPHCRRVTDGWLARRRGTADASAKRCLLDFRKVSADGEQGRRFHALVNLLSRGGYELYLVPRWSFMQTGHRVFKARALELIRPARDAGRDTVPDGFDLCLRDRRGVDRRARRTIEVLTSPLQKLRPRDLAVPYSFYPDVWDRGEDQHFPEYRRRTRQWRLFFGGHCSKESYVRIGKYPWLNPLDRYRVVRETRGYFSGTTFEIESQSQLTRASQARHDSFVMIDNARFRTDSSDWLGLLANADFFLAAPGCDYPLSHNAIEAIAVGTIPVLEYDGLFAPPLRDGENCIAYRGADGLREALSRIEAMPGRQIRALREGVIAYYESHLSPDAFCRKLQAHGPRRMHLFSYLAPTAVAATDADSAWDSAGSEHVRDVGPPGFDSDPLQPEAPRKAG